ncbi:hypothetical protein [Nitrospira sp. Ecomares 2.1]
MLAPLIESKFTFIEVQVERSFFKFLETEQVCFDLPAEAFNPVHLPIPLENTKDKNFTVRPSSKIPLDTLNPKVGVIALRQSAELQLRFTEWPETFSNHPHIPIHPTENQSDRYENDKTVKSRGSIPYGLPGQLTRYSGAVLKPVFPSY